MNPDFIVNEQSYPKTSQLESLVAQIKIDYQAICRLWEQFPRDMTDLAAIDPILQRIAWIRSAMDELNRCRCATIEGIHDGMLESIAMDIAAIQDQIRSHLVDSDR